MKVPRPNGRTVFWAIWCACIIIILAWALTIVVTSGASLLDPLQDRTEVTP